MKKVFLLAFSMLLASISWAYDGQNFSAKTPEGVKMGFTVLSEADKTCKVRGYAIASGTQGTITIPTTPNGYKVTTIEALAFSGCSSLTNITLPEGVTTIGYSAFAYCTSLTNIELPEGLQTIENRAFYNTGLVTLTIPSTVTAIGEYALNGKIIYCNIPDPLAVTRDLAYNAKQVILYVPQGSGQAYAAANYWNKFTIVEMSDENIDWTDGNVTVNVEIPGQLRMSIVELDEDQVKRLVVKGCINSEDLKYLGEMKGKLSELESLDLSDVTLVCDDGCYYTSFTADENSFGAGSYVYYYLSEEEREEKTTGGLSIHGTSYYYRYYGNQLAGAFQGLPLKHIVMPKSITRVARDVFSQCNALESVEFPGGIERIEEFAFSGCGRLRKFDIGQSTSIGKAAFNNCRILETVKNLEKVTSIGPKAFYGCTSFKGNAAGVLSLEYVTEIPEQAFFECSLLSKVHLFDHLQNIGKSAFASCTSLESIRLPQSLMSLPAEVFANCSHLQEVNYSPNLLQVDIESFKNTPWMRNLPIVNGIKYMGHIGLRH